MKRSLPLNPWLVFGLIFFVVDAFACFIIFTVSGGWLPLALPDVFVSKFYPIFLGAWKIFHYPILDFIDELYFSNPTHGAGLAGLFSEIVFFLICCVYALIVGGFVGWVIHKIKGSIK